MTAVPILVPLAAALVTFLLRRASAAIGLVASLGSAAASIVVAVGVATTGPAVHDLGGWGAPLGIALRVDGLAAVMLLMSATVAVPVFLYAATYYDSEGEHAETGEVFWPLALLLLGSLNGLFLSGDAFNVYVALELMTIAAVALVVLEDDDAALTAAMRYLLAAFVGSMLYLLGVALLYAAYGVLDLEVLAGALRPEPAAFLAAALIAAALGLKSALFPMHFWLPRAHASAPAPVSALLSSLVVTGSFYVFLRLWTTVFASIAAPAAGQLVGVLGAGAIIWGSLQALRQQHLKVMIAYSTVAQVGYLFLLIPLVTAALATPEGIAGWGATAWSGGVYHAVTHALAKSAMFLSAGVLVAAIGSDRIVGISGIARELPIATYAFGIAGMTLIGLPPSGGFVAKWLLLSAALQSGQWWWAVVMLVGGVLTAGYVFLVLGQELSLAGSDHEVELRPVSKRMEYAAFLLAVAALVLGVRVAEPLALLQIGAPFGGP
ncbi:MAG TPA: proton-conducting transporter membrane subunit [Candidatus Limnocylindrales bacterium]|nr:proton-conducting transporter membrane subunit [Candidatus Limnocylindrales bacterium]